MSALPLTMDTTRAGALTVAMAILPSLYSRNKLFGLFRDPVVKHARSRARLVRSVLRQWASGQAREIHITRAERCVVTFRMPSAHASRKVILSPLELACLLYVVSRAGLEEWQPSAAERSMLDNALATLPSVPAIDW